MGFIKKLPPRKRIELYLSEMFNGYRGEMCSREYGFEFVEIVDAFKLYVDYLVGLKDRFKIKKEYDVGHIANQIFSTSRNDFNKCKNHILAIIIIGKDLLEEVKKDAEIERIQLTDNYVKGKLLLIYDFVRDVNEVIWQYKELFLSISQTEKSGRRRMFSGDEIFYTSKNILRRQQYFSNISYPAVSVFLIRQSIEVRFLNALGIASIVDEKNEPVRFKVEEIINFVYKNKRIKMPCVDKALTLKIYNWTNFYIHRGVLYYCWEILLAQKILLPLFSSGYASGIYSLHGSIVIDKSYFSTDLHKDLLQHLGLEASEIKINRIENPECILG